MDTFDTLDDLFEPTPDTLDDPFEPTPGALDDLDNYTAYTIADQHPTPREKSIEWVCAGADPGLFFPTNDDQLADGRSYCERCPAKAVCLRLGVNRNEWGLWGGVLLEEGVAVDALTEEDALP